MGDACIDPHLTTLIVGGHGRTALLLTGKLITADPPHFVYGVIRSPDQIPDLEAAGARPIVQDLVSGTEDDFVRIFERVQPDFVVWAASAPRNAVAVDRDGAIKVIRALGRAKLRAGRKRYLAISAADIRDREGKPVPDWYSDADVKLSDRMWGVIGAALRAKFEADKELVEGSERREIKYTIVRPGGLSDEPEAGRILAGKVGLQGMVSREDVAGVLHAAMENDKSINLAFDVLGGEDKDTGVKEGVEGVAKRREDTFEGYH